MASRILSGSRRKGWCQMPPLDSTTFDPADFGLVPAPAAAVPAPPSQTVMLGAGGGAPVTLPPGLPPVNLPTVGAAKADQEPAAIDVGHGRAVAGPQFNASIFCLVPAAPPPPAAPPAVPQMTGVAREAALPASAVAGGLVSGAATPGEVVRGLGALGGAQAASTLQGQPLPALAPLPTATPSPSGTGMLAPPSPTGMPANAAQLFTPQQLAAAPGKENIPAPTGHNPLDAQSLMGLTDAAGITNRPDLQPQTAREKMEAAAAGGIGMVAPAGLTGGASTLPAAARLMLSGAGLGLGSTAGGAVGQAVGGKPGEIVGSIAGGVLPALAGGAVGAVAKPLISALEPALVNAPFIGDSVAKNMAARTCAPANTAVNRAALANPRQFVPGSEGTSYQVTGDPWIGGKEAGVANKQEYQPLFAAKRQGQNRAQITHMAAQAPSVGVKGVVPWFSGRLKAMNDADAAEGAANRAATQAAVSAMGAPTVSHEAGGVVRDAMEAKRAPDVAASDKTIVEAAADRSEERRVGK